MDDTEKKLMRNMSLIGLLNTLITQGVKITAEREFNLGSAAYDIKITMERFFGETKSFTLDCKDFYNEDLLKTGICEYGIMITEEAEKAMDELNKAKPLMEERIFFNPYPYKEEEEDYE